MRLCLRKNSEIMAATQWKVYFLFCLFLQSGNGGIEISSTLARKEQFLQQGTEFWSRNPGEYWNRLQQEKMEEWKDKVEKIGSLERGVSSYGNLKTRKMCYSLPRVCRQNPKPFMSSPDSFAFTPDDNDKTPNPNSPSLPCKKKIK